MHDIVMDVASEVLYLYSVGIDDLGLSPFKCWDELGDVEDLSIVEDAGLDFLHGGSTKESNKSRAPVYVEMFLSHSQSERLISIVASIFKVSPV